MKAPATLFFLVATCWQCLAQKPAALTPATLPLDENTHRITYTAVVPVADASQAALLAWAKVWATGVTTAASPPLVTSESGTDMITVSGSQPLTQKMGFNTIMVPLRFTATISLRAGRYQYHFSDFVIAYTEALKQAAELPLIEAPAAKKGTKSYLKSVRNGFDEAVAAALAKLQETMSKPLAQTGKTDW